MNKIKCIVLRKIRYGEADLILHTIEQNGSKMNFLARAALKSKKRFSGGVLEPSHYIQASYQEARKNRTGELHVLKEAALIDDFPGIKRKYERLDTAFQILQLTDQLSQEQDLDAENVFHLLGNSLRALEKRDDLRSFQLQFELKLLNYLGVLPRMEGVGNYLERPMNETVEGEAPRELEHRVRTVIERYRKGLSG